MSWAGQTGFIFSKELINNNFYKFTRFTNGWHGQTSLSVHFTHESDGSPLFREESKTGILLKERKMFLISLAGTTLDRQIGHFYKGCACLPSVRH